MSASKRRRIQTLVFTVFRLHGGYKARLLADMLLRQQRGTRIRCPQCDGTRRDTSSMTAEDLEARRRRGKGAPICELCRGKGAVGTSAPALLWFEGLEEKA